MIGETENSAARTEDIDTRLAKLQQELMNVVRMSDVDSEEYSRVVGEIEALRHRRVELKNAENEKSWRDSKLDEFKAFLTSQGTLLDKFDGDLFRRLVEKLRFCRWSRWCLCLKQGLRLGRY